MSDFEQPALKHLRGWLLVYVFVVSAPGIVWNGIYSWAYVTSGTYTVDAMFRFVAFAAFATSLCLIIWVRKRITREYTIWLNLILACVYLVSHFLADYPKQSFVEYLLERSAFWFFFWMAYWIRSNRVKETYCQSAGWIP